MIRRMAADSLSTEAASIAARFSTMMKRQKSLAEKSKETLEKSGKFQKPIATEILKLSKFYPAEDYHQDYYKKNPLRYQYYRFGSGRDQFLEECLGTGAEKPEKSSAGNKIPKAGRSRPAKETDSPAIHGHPGRGDGASLPE